MRRCFIFGVLAVLVGFAGIGFADPVEVDLLAGQYMDAGNVTISNDADDLEILFQMAPGWQLKSTAIEVVSDPSAFPQTRKGNPIPGHFTYKQDHAEGTISYTETISLVGYLPGMTLYVAVHAVVEQLQESACIDFEDPALDEKDEVSAMSTGVGTVNFYMTAQAPLVGLGVGDSADLLPSGLYPIIAVPDTSPPLGNIVAYAVDDTAGQTGNVLRDDWVKDDAGTGAGGKLLTDPQDLSQPELRWHLHTQGLAFVIDVSSIVGLTGLSMAVLDLDFTEMWWFLCFNGSNEVIATQQVGPGDQSTDGVASPALFPYPVAKVVLWGGNNNGFADRIGYAIDQIRLFEGIERREETAWADGIEFMPGKKGNWGMYVEYTVQEVAE